MANTLKSSKYLEAARSRLHMRVRNIFPAAFVTKESIASAKPPSTLVETSSSTRNQPEQYLEAARLRIRNRFHEKFPTVTQKQQTLTNPINSSKKNNNKNNNTDSPLEQARLRIRDRFRRQFVLSEWIEEKLPKSLNEAQNATWLDNDQAMVVTTARSPFPIVHVNRAWEDLCGYSKSEAVGQTFVSLGIQTPAMTESFAIAYLEEQLHQKRPAAVHLTNTRKDESTFLNFLRMAPLKDKDSSEITHFIGVLQEAGRKKETARS